MNFQQVCAELMADEMQDPKPEKPHVVRTSVVEDVLKNICWTCVQTDPPRVGFLLWILTTTIDRH